jgi:hypothetical protein
VGSAVSDSDPSHYFGVATTIVLEKRTNGEDADQAPGVLIPVGEAVHWTYAVTNTSNVPVANVSVIDDQGATVSCPKTELEPGESMVCTAAGIAVAGQYANLGTAVATPPDGPAVSAQDWSHYFGFNPNSFIYLPLVLRNYWVIPP